MHVTSIQVILIGHFQEIDIVTYGLVPTPNRSAVMDFPYPTFIHPYRLLVRRPEEESRVTAIIRPFQSEVRLTFSLYLCKYSLSTINSFAITQGVELDFRIRGSHNHRPGLIDGLSQTQWGFSYRQRHRKSWFLNSLILYYYYRTLLR